MYKKYTNPLPYCSRRSQQKNVRLDFWFSSVYHIKPRDIALIVVIKGDQPRDNFWRRTAHDDDSAKYIFEKFSSFEAALTKSKSARQEIKTDWWMQEHPKRNGPALFTNWSNERIGPWWWSYIVGRVFALTRSTPFKSSHRQNLFWTTQLYWIDENQEKEACDQS